MEFIDYLTLNEADVETSDMPPVPMMMMGYPMFQHTNFSGMRQGRGRGWWNKFAGGDKEFAGTLKDAMKKHGGAFIGHPDRMGMYFLNERSSARSLEDLTKRLGSYRHVGKFNDVEVLVNLHTIRRVMERDEQKNVNKIMDHVYKRATKWLSWRKDLRNKKFVPLAIISKGGVFSGKIVAYYTNQDDMKMLWITTMLSGTMSQKKSDKTLIIEQKDGDAKNECYYYDDDYDYDRRHHRHHDDRYIENADNGNQRRRGDYDGDHMHHGGYDDHHNHREHHNGRNDHHDYPHELAEVVDVDDKYDYDYHHHHRYGGHHYCGY